MEERGYRRTCAAWDCILSFSFNPCAGSLLNGAADSRRYITRARGSADELHNLGFVMVGGVVKADSASLSKQRRTPSPAREIGIFLQRYSLYSVADEKKIPVPER